MQGKLEELGFNFLAGLELRAVADDHQVAFLQAGQHLVFVRRFQTQLDGAFLNLPVPVDD